MEISGISIEQFSDIGFALLVGGICLRTLLFDRDANIKQRAIWKHELTELEKSLRQLIDEATQASELFDKQLTFRQQSIEELLDRAEKMASTSYAKASVSQSAKSNSENKSESKSLRPPKKEIEVEKDWEFGEDLPDHLIDALELTEDKTTIRKDSTKKVKSNVVENYTATAVEKKAAIAEEKIFSQTSIVDPVAYRIAKRLLLEGKELHVIARKLEIPVSEIRHLETLIRQYAQVEHADLPETFLAKEIGDVKKIIRDPALKKNGKSQLSTRIETVRNERQPLSLEFEQEENDLFGLELGE